MKDRRSKSNQRRRDENNSVMMRSAKQQQSKEGEPHADSERERLSLLVGKMPDHRLQQRGGKLERQRDHPDLREVQRIVVLQDRVDRRYQRLHGVVEEMREADSRQHDVGW